MMAPVQDVGVWHLVYNGVDLSAFDFTKAVRPDAPLVFLGRIEHIKGTHLAIDVARKTGIPLVIAGNIAPEHRAYFTGQVQPHIDGKLITFLGPVDDAQKNDLLGRARALLMPVLWEEPFGIVMAEAMACGTPVIGLARGAVPEIVEEGKTGFVCGDLDGLVTAANRVGAIDKPLRDAFERAPTAKLGRPALMLGLVATAPLRDRLRTERWSSAAELDSPLNVREFGFRALAGRA